MARVTGPLMSFDASGSVAGSIVFSKWRGRNYVRRHAIPSNPRTPAQLCARSILAFLGSGWKSIGGSPQASWEDGADSLKISAFNEYIRVNARNWRDLFAPSKTYPATREISAVTIDTITAVVSGRQVSLDVNIDSMTGVWGVALTRSLVTEENESIAQAVAIAVPVTLHAYFLDGPLAPDTYYYNAIAFSTDGTLGVCGTEASALVV